MPHQFVVVVCQRHFVAPSPVSESSPLSWSSGNCFVNFRDAPQDKIERRVRAAEKRLQAAMEESDEEMKDSSMKGLCVWENKHHFYNILLAMDLLPADVPGDGNCGLWTLIALESGNSIQTNLVTPDRMMQMRQDFVFMFWDVLFRNLTPLRDT